MSDIDPNVSSLPTLVTRVVFLDSTVFIGANFHYGRKAFQRLSELTMFGELQMLISDIVEREVESNIRQAVRGAATAAKRFRKEAHILADLRLPAFEGVFERLDVESLSQVLLKRHVDFITSCTPTVLSASDGTTNDVFRAYFAGEPPFGEGKNKAEFPDGFIVSGVLNWAITNSKQVYLISGDEGIRKACEDTDRLIHLPALTDLLDLVAHQQKMEAAAAMTWFKGNRSRVEGEVAGRFADLGFMTDLYESDVEDVEASRVVLLQPQLLDASQGSADLEVLAEIDFSAVVHYEDEESGIWDSEDKRWLFRETVSKRVTRTVVLPVYVALTFGDELDVKSMTLTVNWGGDVEIPFHGDDEWM